ncbi:transglycosylase SLT domain-containing protein [Rhodococcus sp. NPDC056960]|uniref:transglycosylase SLT domain-containing protein n=1 Tax=Rhodococcus sp. NPDC056960 TaxID=3345982 RepID=UPI00363F0412
MTAPYASAVVEARLDWGNIDSEFEARVRAAVEKASKAAQKNLDKIKLAAKVSLNPKIAEFRTETQEKLDKVNLRANVKLKADTSELAAKVAGMKSSLPKVEVSLKPKVSDSDFTKFVTDLRTRLVAANVEVPVTLTLNDAGYQARLRALTASPVNQRVNIIANGDSTRRTIEGLSGGPVRRIRMQIDLDRASVARAQAEVTAVEGRLTEARRRQTDATGRVSQAEARLAEVRARVTSTASQTLAAQNALSRAQHGAADASSRLTSLIGDQADAHRRLRRAQEDQNSMGRLARAGLGGVAEAVGDLGRNVAGMINPAGLARTALMALAAVSLVPLLGQLTQAAGVLALLPAMGAAAAAGLATMIIGSTGVFDAFSKGSKAADAAAAASAQGSRQAEEDAKKRASAARQVASAQRGVENAVDGVNRAERGVTTALRNAQKAQEAVNRAREDAKDTIDDLNFALKGTAIDERDAALALARAREQYDQTFTDPGASALDRAEASLNIDKALRRQEEVGRQNTKIAKDAAEANKKGIEGSDQVVAAKEAVADADQGIVDANKAVIDAQEQLADAQQNLIDAQEAAAEATSDNTKELDDYALALANLSPNAADFVTKVRGLSEEWKALRTEVQDDLFDGLGDGVVELAKVYLPILRTGFSGIATEINGGISRFFTDLKTEHAQGNFKKIFENAQLAIGPLMDGLSSLSGALGNIAAIGSDFLPGLTGDFASLMQRFETWTSSEEGQNKIREFLRESMEAFGQIKDLFLAIGNVIGGLFATSEKNGKSMIQSMTDGLNKFAEWMRSPEGIERMSQFWSDAQQTAKDLLTLVGQAITLADKVSTLTGNNFGLTTPKGDAAPDPILDPQGNDGGSTGYGTKDPDSQPYSNSAGFVDVPMLPGGFDDSPAGSIVVDAFGGRDSWERFIDGFTEGGYDKKLGMLQSFGIFAQKMVPGLTQAKALGGELVTALGDVAGKAVELGGVFLDEIQTKAGNAWNSLSDKVSSTWTTNISPAIEAFKRDGLTGLANHFTSTITNGAVLSWNDLPSAIGSGIASIVDQHFPGFRDALSGMREFFGGVVDGISAKWAELKATTAEPINFIIDHVINGALKTAWNGLAKILPGLEQWEGVARIESPDAGKAEGFGKPLAGMYTGGIIPGYTPGRDPYTIGVSGGEAVMRPEWTRAMGPDYVNSMNQIARTQGIAGVQRHAGYFSNGGIVDNLQSIMAEKYPMLQMTSGLRYTDNGLHSKGMAADFSNAGIEGSPEMKSASQWWYENFGPDLLQLIHMPFNNNVLNGQNVGDGMGSPGYGEATMLEHRHHLHVGTDKILNGDGTSSPAEPGFLDRVKNMVGDAVGAGRNAIASQARGIIAAPFDAVKSAMPDFGPSMLAQIPGMMIDRIRDAVTQKALGFIGAGGSSADAGNTPWDLGAGVEQWRGKVIAALQREGFDAGIRNQNLMLAQIMSESSGNPNAIQQVQDVNSGGNEAVGLLQVIPGTFATHRNPALPNDRTNPDASMSAALRYYRSKYGDDLGTMWGQGHGYDLGGLANGIGLMPKKILTPERVLSPEMTADFERLVKVLERPDFIEVLRSLDKAASDASSVTTAATNAANSMPTVTPAPAVAGAAAATGPAGPPPMVAFNPNNKSYDPSFYGDTVALGGVEGANAWLARQDFAPAGRTWLTGALKEIGGEFAEPVGLQSAWGGLVDRGASDAMKFANGQDGQGTTVINNTFNGYQGTPQQMIAEWERSQQQRMAPVTGTYRNG